MNSFNTESDIFGIAYGCPKGIRDNDCPLMEIEPLSFKEKIEWINKLDVKKKKAILRHHAFCTKKVNSKMIEQRNK